MKPSHFHNFASITSFLSQIEVNHALTEVLLRVLWTVFVEQACCYKCSFDFATVSLRPLLRHLIFDINEGLYIYICLYLDFTNPIPLLWKIYLDFPYDIFSWWRPPKSLQGCRSNKRIIMQIRRTILTQLYNRNWSHISVIKTYNKRYSAIKINQTVNVFS